MSSVPGPGYAEWDEAGRPGEVQVGRLQIGGMRAEEAEEFYIYQYLIRAVPSEPADYGLSSIVIVTHNQLAHTRQCVESIRERTDEPYELVFVGYHVVVARDTLVHHFAGRTFVGSGVDFAAQMRRNQQLFREKWRAIELEASREDRAAHEAAPAVAPPLTPPSKGGDGMGECREAVGGSVKGANSEYRIEACAGGGLVVQRPSDYLSVCIIMRDNAGTIGACLACIAHRLPPMRGPRRESVGAGAASTGEGSARRRIDDLHLQN